MCTYYSKWNNENLPLAVISDAALQFCKNVIINRLIIIFVFIIHSYREALFGIYFYKIRCTTKTSDYWRKHYMNNENIRNTTSIYSQTLCTEAFYKLKHNKAALAREKRNAGKWRAKVSPTDSSNLGSIYLSGRSALRFDLYKYHIMYWRDESGTLVSRVWCVRQYCQIKQREPAISPHYTLHTREPAAWFSTRREQK